jgi:hypothetical protein
MREAAGYVIGYGGVAIIVMLALVGWMGGRH